MNSALSRKGEGILFNAATLTLPDVAPCGIELVHSLNPACGPVTPIRRQYLKIKEAYRDSIVLFRMGDFYETFDDDAKLVARELDITLTGRSLGKNLRVPMAGVPAHSVDSYLARLVRKGHQVAICEQLSDPAAAKGLVDRDVVRVVTPGTVFEDSLLDQRANNYLAAVFVRGGLAGLAYADITTGEFAATQLPLEQLPLELGRIAPAEVLATEADALTIATADAQWRASAIDDAPFEYRQAEAALLSCFRIHTLESFGCEDLPLAVSAAGAIVDYLDRTRPATNSAKGAKVQLNNLAVYSAHQYMALDARTRRNLELFEGGRGEQRELSVLAAIDRTRTVLGSRLLRRWLGQPLLDLTALERRLDAVDSFYRDGLARGAVSSALAGVADLERIMGRVVSGTVAPRELLALKTGLDALPELRERVAGLGDALQWLHSELLPAPEVAALIEAAIEPEPSGSVGEGGVIRRGFSARIDELKDASVNARQYIAGLEQKERERTGVRALKVGYNQVFGYYIEIPKSQIGSLPDDYQRRQTLTNAERYIVPDLKEYESRVLTAREELAVEEEETYRRICAQVAESARHIACAAAAIAQVDVFCGLAQTAVDSGYVRPVVDAGPDIRIREGRHPVVERVLASGEYVPNDVELSGDARVLVLTGPNMAGKSTYIRQVALITLLAQVGSFVPAAEARIGIVDRIFTRVGLQDDLATGQSTFMVEMVETAAILNQATPRSLLILDEIGRGTSTYDGLSIARAVIEHLHNDPRLGCKTLFATHYHELTQLAASLPGVRNFSVAVAEEGSEVVFLHRIIPGGADKSYGVHVARLAGLPQGVINRAWEVLTDLESQVGNSRRRATRAAPSQQLALFAPGSELADTVRGLDVPNMTPLEALNKLYELQEQANSQP